MSVTLNKPYRSKPGRVSIRVRSEPVTFDYKPQQDESIAKVIVELVRKQIRNSNQSPEPVTMARDPGRPARLLFNTGRFLRGLTARLSGKVWVTEAPNTRMNKAEAIRNVREALEKVLDMAKLIRDPAYRAATLVAWRKGVKVGRMQG